MPVRIVTDSACDLPQPMCDELDIEIVPLTIRFGEKEYVDREELSTEQFWRELQASNVLPETAAPSVGAFEETFRRLADEGADAIVCINLSSRLSATMQSAQVAAKAIEDDVPVHIVDSESASMGIGNLVLHAARRAAAGASADEIVRDVEERRERQHIIATLDTVEYLRKGGRIGSAQAVLGSMLSIKPLISVVDGAVAAVGKVRTRSKAMQAVLDRIPDEGIEQIAVLHSMAPEMDEFIEKLRPKIEGAELVVGLIGPVIGVHAGPGVIGVAYVTRPDVTDPGAVKPA